MFSRIAFVFCISYVLIACESSISSFPKETLQQSSFDALSAPKIILKGPALTQLNSCYPLFVEMSYF